MTIQQCRYALAIAQAGSFHEAAIRLFISQASLSESVRNLEKELGIMLFLRSNKGVSITREGAEFLHYAAQLVSQAEMIEDRYRSAAAGKRLRVSAQHYDFAAEVFAQFLNTSTQQEFALELKETRTHEAIEQVKNALCDLGVIAMRKSESALMERYLAKNQLQFHSLAETAPHVFMRRGHPLSQHTIVEETELQAFPYVFYEQGENAAALFSEELESAAICRKRVRINDRATLLNLLLSTDCCTIGTGIMTSSLSQDVIAIPLRSAEKYAIGWIARREITYTEEMLAFIKMLEEFFEKLCACT